MILLMYQYTFYGKKQRLYSFLIMLIIVLFSLLTYEDMSYHEVMLYQDDLNHFYNQSTQRLMIWIFPFLCQMFFMDHDQPFLKPFIVYFKAYDVLSHKLCFYILITLWLVFIFFSLYHVIPFLFTRYYVMDQLYMHFFIHLFLDGLMILILNFLLIRMTYQALSLFIPIFYMLYAFLLEDQSERLFYLIFPIYKQVDSLKSLEFYYKICYILIGFIMIFLESSKKNH